MYKEIADISNKKHLLNFAINAKINKTMGIEAKEGENWGKVASILVIVIHIKCRELYLRILQIM